MFLSYFILITVSSAGMLFMIVSKMFEMNSGKVGHLAKLSVYVDPALHKKIVGGKEILRYVNWTNIRKVANIAIHNLFHLFGVAGLFVSKYYEKIKSLVRGKKTIKTGGVVSFFLKNMAESSKEKEKNHE